MNKTPLPEQYLTPAQRDAYEAQITEQEPFEGTNLTMPWAMYEPMQAMLNPEQKFPMVVVLHGGYGRESDDGHITRDVAQYILGSENALLSEKNRAAYPAYVLLPHCWEYNPDGGCGFYQNEWVPGGGSNYNSLGDPSRSGKTAIELVEHMIKTYNVDPARIYVTGNSMGGGGTWDFAIRRPDLFAAAVPVSGHTPNRQSYLSLADSKLPVWAFTASQDNNNPQRDTDAATSAISTNGGCTWQTRYTGAGHDDVLWRNPYMETGLWPWLFAQRIPRVGDPGAGEPFPKQ